MKLKKIALAIIPIVAIILEILPYGAVLNFAKAPEAGGGVYRETDSYFSLNPFGYANFAPFIAALLTCLILIFALLFLFAGIGGKAIKITAIIACLISLCPLLLGISYFSVIGAIISVLLCVEFVISMKVKTIH